jgi:hypothetical protein
LTDILPPRSSFYNYYRLYFNDLMEDWAEKLWHMPPGCFGLGSWEDLVELEDSEGEWDKSQAVMT